MPNKGGAEVHVRYCFWFLILQLMKFEEMTEDDLKRFWEASKQEEELARIEKEEFDKQIIKSVLKIPLEGFMSEENKIELSDNLVIEKVSKEFRDTFFNRASALELSNFSNENNWFFLNYRFDVERRKLNHIESSNRILSLAIFFAICSKKQIRINKAQEYNDINGELRSTGIMRIANAPFYYDLEARFETEDVDELKKRWPLFNSTYHGKPHFALVARRYYFSLIRNQWEDQIVDLIISLEAMLIPEMDETNKSGKIVRRLSRLLNQVYLRGEVSKVAKACYAIRNEIVHGGFDHENLQEIQRNKENLIVFVKTAIQIYLEDYRGLTLQEFADLNK